jgi:hypothetical protein
VTSQLDIIHEYMLGAGWRTLREIQRDLEWRFAPRKFLETGISARLRELKRPPRRCRVAKRRRGLRNRGLYEYRVLPPLDESGGLF